MQTQTYAIVKLSPRKFAVVKHGETVGNIPFIAIAEAVSMVNSWEAAADFIRHAPAIHEQPRSEGSTTAFHRKGKAKAA